MRNSPDSTASLLHAPSGAYITRQTGTGEDVDLSLLRHSLSMTPWERMLANDDALNFADTLQAAMKQRNAKPQ